MINLNSRAKNGVSFFLGAYLVLTYSLAYAQSPVPDRAILKKVAGGFQFTEGPLWVNNGALLFSDIPANTIYEWKPDNGLKVFLKPSGHSNGIALLGDGTLVIAQKDRTVSRIAGNRKVEVTANEYNGRKLNAPNDLVVRSDGTVYFTDPAIGVKQQQTAQPVNGVYRISEGNKVQLLASEVPVPNGLAFSPGETKLYVNDSRANDIWVFDVDSDGSLHNGSIFARMRDPGAKFGSADGLKVDSRGNVFSTGPGGIWIYSPEGTLLDRISTPEYASNLAFGGVGYKTLFITATHDIYSIPVKYSGEHQ